MKNIKLNLRGNNFKEKQIRLKIPFNKLPNEVGEWKILSHEIKVIGKGYYWFCKCSCGIEK